MLFIVTILGLLHTIASKEIHYLHLRNYADIKHDKRPLVILFHNQDRVSKRFYGQFQNIINNPEFQALNFAQADASKEEKLIEKTQVTQFPTSYLYLADGSKHKYQGHWVIENYVAWLKKLLLQDPNKNLYVPVYPVNTLTQLQGKFERFQAVSVINTEKEDLLRIQQRVAQSLNASFYFAYIKNQSIAQQLKMEQDEIMLYSKNEDRHQAMYESDPQEYYVRYDGAMEYDEILTFHKIHTKTRFFYLDYHKYQQLSRRNDNYMTIIYIFNSSIVEQNNQALHLKSLQRWAYRKTYIAINDVTKDAYTLKDDFQYDDSELPMVVAVKSKGNGKYYWKYKCNKGQGFEADKAVMQCYDDIVSHRLTHFFKDQNITEEVDENGVRILNATSYHKFIKQQKDEGKDVLMYIYKTGCGNCEEFKPTWHKVVKKLQSSPSADKMTAAQIDWGLNELEVEGVQRFPHVFIYPKDGSSPVDATKQKTYKELLKSVSQYVDL